MGIPFLGKTLYLARKVVVDYHTSEEMISRIQMSKSTRKIQPECDYTELNPR